LTKGAGALGQQQGDQHRRGISGETAEFRQRLAAALRFGGDLGGGWPGIVRGHEGFLFLATHHVPGPRAGGFEVQLLGLAGVAPLEATHRPCHLNGQARTAPARVGDRPLLPRIEVADARAVEDLLRTAPAQLDRPPGGVGADLESPGSRFLPSPPGSIVGGIVTGPRAPTRGEGRPA
jgi:hypothetical protein